MAHERYVIGADECGWGSLAGPLVVCAVALPDDYTIAGLRDSKRLPPKRRVELRERMADDPFIQVSVGIMQANEIDQMGPAHAYFAAYKRALSQLIDRHPYAMVELDGSLANLARVVTWLRETRLRTVHYQPKADTIVPAVMAASVFGKVRHDEKMAKLALLYPAYDFDSNQGYRSPKHEEGLAEHGPCPEHRRSYAPVRRAVEAFAARAVAPSDDAR